jgi:hypothetical protein
MAKVRNLKEQVLNDNEEMAHSRDDLMQKVCHIIMLHINAAEHLIPKPTEGACLFHNQNFKPHKW